MFGSILKTVTPFVTPTNTRLDDGSTATEGVVGVNPFCAVTSVATAPRSRAAGITGKRVHESAVLATHVDEFVVGTDRDVVPVKTLDEWAGPDLVQRSIGVDLVALQRTRQERINTGLTPCPLTKKCMFVGLTFRPIEEGYRRARSFRQDRSRRDESRLQCSMPVTLSFAERRNDRPPS